MKKEEIVKKKSQDLIWWCSNCGKVLGFIESSSRSKVRIKYKDFYLFVEGGRVTQLCRKCGEVNYLFDPDYENFIKQQQKEVSK